MLEPSLPLTSSHPSCQESAHQGREKCQSRNSWPGPQGKGHVANSSKDLQGISTAGEWKLSASCQLQGSCLQKRGGRKPSADALGPKPSFTGLLGDGVASRDCRHPWAVAWAEPGWGLGPMEEKVGRGGRCATNHLLAALGRPGATRWTPRDPATPGTPMALPSAT